MTFPGFGECVSMPCLQKEYKGCTRKVPCSTNVKFSPDGNWLAGHSGDRIGLNVWETKSYSIYLTDFRKESAFPFLDSREYNSLYWSNSSRKIILVDKNGQRVRAFMCK
jgi:WD40 repeat protein